MSNPYYKTTKGYNAEVIVAKSVAYTTDATYEDFVDNAAEGEIGIFDASDDSLITGFEVDGITPKAEAAGTEVFIAQKRDGGIHKSTVFKLESGIGTYTDYVAPVKNKWTIDSSGLTVAAGKIYELAIIELTRGTQPYHVWNFDYTAKSGDTIATVVDALVEKINDAKDPANYAYGQIAVGTNSTNDLVLEAKDFGRLFKVVVRQDLADAAVTQTTKFKLGSGTYEGVRQLEAEGMIFDGVTTNYPNQNITAEEFGKPTEFAESGVTYDIAIFKPWATEASPLPFHEHKHKKYILIAIPSSGTTPKAAFKGAFGFA